LRERSDVESAGKLHLDSLGTLDFYKPGRIGNAREVATDIERADPGIDSIVARAAK